MKFLVRTAIVVAGMTLVPAVAMAEERVGDAALGAVAGAIVGGPVGLVAGGVIGFTAGPGIADEWGLHRHHYYHRHHHQEAAKEH